MQITPEELERIAKCPAERARRFAGPISTTMARYEITTTRRAAHFLGQILHESARLSYTTERWGPTNAQLRYEGREDLGNTQRGDGFRFRGRGLIQLTGRANYAMYSRACGIDFVADPDRVAALPWCCDVAGWYWQLRDLNALADRDDHRAITTRINGGLNGLDNRVMLTERAKQVLSERPKAIEITKLQPKPLQEM